MVVVSMANLGTNFKSGADMMDKFKAVLTAIFITIFCTVLGACTTATPEAVLETHGDSVRNMIAEQTYTPEDEVGDFDGEKSRKVLEAYRGDVAEPKKVEKEVIRVKFD